VRYVPSLDGVAYEEFVPNESRRGWRGVLHSFWFDGHVKRG
jgi:predicted nucleotidyltransferase